MQVAHLASGCPACGYKTASGRGKWLSRDPIGEIGGLNLYTYVGNDPFSRTDPLGLILGTPLSAEEYLTAVKNGVFQGVEIWGNAVSFGATGAIGNGLGETYSFATGIPAALGSDNYNRNQYNFAPPTEDYVRSNRQFWRKVPDKDSQFHQVGTCPNQGNNKYVSPNGHYEAVYDADGNLVTRGPNIGTYNYYDYSDGTNGYINHFLYDVIPWAYNGNSPNEPHGSGPAIDRFLSGNINGHPVQN